MKRTLSLVALACLAATAFAERIELGAGKAVLLTVPDGWIADKPSAGLPGAPEFGRTARYVTKNGSNDALVVTAIPVADDRLAAPESVKAMAEAALRRFAETSVEGKVVLKEFKFGGVPGVIATFTDASLVGKPAIKDDYKAMTSGFVYLGDGVLVTATIFTDTIDGRSYLEAQRMLRSLSLRLPNDQI